MATPQQYRNNTNLLSSGLAAYDKFENRTEEEETEVTFSTKITNPIVEKDTRIQLLEKEQEKMPALEQELKNTKAVLRARRKEQAMEDVQFKLAKNITEQRTAENIKNSPSCPSIYPHLVSMIVVFQERDQFTVDPATADIKPNKEEYFLQTICNDVNLYADQEDSPLFSKQDYKERLLSLKSKVLEKIKEDKRFFPGTSDSLIVRAGRRDSTSSTSSKRLLEGKGEDRSSSRQRRESLPPFIQ